MKYSFKCVSSYRTDQSWSILQIQVAYDFDSKNVSSFLMSFIKLQRNNLQFQTQRPSNTGNYTRLYKVSLRCSARVQHRKM